MPKFRPLSDDIAAVGSGSTCSITPKALAGTVGFEPTLSESKSDVFTTSLCANVSV